MSHGEKYNAASKDGGIENDHQKGYIMWRSLRIAQKIWFGLGILILGYLASMMLGFFLGKRTESQLEVVEGSLFPAAIRPAIRPIGRHACHAGGYA
jgi:hypothetical protein